MVSKRQIVSWWWSLFDDQEKFTLVVTRVVMPSEFVDLELLAVDINSRNSEVSDVLPFRIVVQRTTLL